MWDHLPVHNLISLQRIAALKKLDRQIAEDWANGYGADVDTALEHRQRLVELLRGGPDA